MSMYSAPHDVRDPAGRDARAQERHAACIYSRVVAHGGNQPGPTGQSEQSGGPRGDGRLHPHGEGGRRVGPGSTRSYGRNARRRRPRSGYMAAIVGSTAVTSRE
jgi:hypothetical protein